MKKAISLLLALVLILSMIPTAFAASDEAMEAASALNVLGLFGGTGTDANGNPIYDLDRAPTRQEAVTMLVRLLGKAEEAKTGTWTTPFADVDEWAKPYVGYAYEHGLTSGTSTTTFGGSSFMTATQYITLVLRALGYESGADFQWDQAWELSDEIGLTNGQYHSNSKEFLRGDVAIISYNALSQKLKNQETALVTTLVSNGAVDGDAAVQQGLDGYNWLGNITYQYGLRSFTVYAFANYTGYDDNNRYDIVGTRKAIRDDLFKLSPKISDPDYFKEKGRPSASILAALGDAPTFEFLSGATVPSGMRDLPQKLAEFYVAADIPALYEKYRPDYEEALRKYEKEATSPLLKSIAYFNAEAYLPDGFILEVQLMEAVQRGYTMGSNFNKYDNTALVVCGPTFVNNGVNTINFVHEYYHLVTKKPILDKLNYEINAISKYHTADDTVAKQQGYTKWVDIINESVVRAISGFFVPSYGRSYAQRETDKGFTLTLYIYDRIPEFESYGGDFADFLEKLLVEYPQYADKY